MHLFILLYNFLLKYSSFTMCKCTSKWFSCTYIYKGFPGGTVAKKKSTCQCRRYQRLGFVPWVRKIPWRRKWQPSPVFLPGKFHGQKILAGYSPWGRKELNIAEHTHTHIYIYIHSFSDSFHHGLRQGVEYSSYTMQWILVAYLFYIQLCVSVCPHAPLWLL